MRLARDDYYMRIARDVSLRATCARRAVGCVLTNEEGDILATGYNGPPSGWTHCTDVPCPGAKEEHGKGLELCEAVHAEQNALLQCRNARDIYAAYCSTAPCAHCTKILLNTSCRVIVVGEPYERHDHAREWWISANRRWIQMPRE